MAEEARPSAIERTELAGAVRPTTRPAAPGPAVHSGATPTPGGQEAGSFGRILMDLGLLSDEQLRRALETQRERSRRGDFARLGHILVEMGFVTPEQVQQVLRAQQITILACEACGSQFNVRGFDQRTRYQCPKCHGQLQTAQSLKHVYVQDQLQAAPPTPQALDDTARLTRPEETHTARIRQLKLLGRYEILGELARGGMGIIYKARQLDLDRVVALKTLRQEELAKPDAAARFRGEAQAVARLRHPHIVAVHEVGSFDGIEYFTMEFVEGLPLDRRILRDPRLTPRQAVEIVVPIAEALEYAHTKGVVHRDLKPANIIIDSDGIPFLVDWGIAKRMDEGLAADEEEDLLGSIPYMAPEYVEGAAYDQLCDLYSLGVVLYEALGGPNCLPYYDPDTRRFLEQIMQEPPKPILSRVPDLDVQLAEIVERMIAPRPQRYGSMHQVVDDLRRWLLREDKMAGVGPSTAKLLRSPPPRHPPRYLVAALGASALGLIWTTWGLHTARSELRQVESAQGQRELADARLLLPVIADQASELTRQGELEPALRLCTQAIDRWQALALKELAPVYRLRAHLRRQRGDAGAADDELAARKLLGE